MLRAFRSVMQSSLSLLMVSLIALLPNLAGAGALAAATPAPPAQGRTRPLPISGSRAFVNYRADGKVGCREATGEEASALKRRGSQSLHVISPDRSVRTQSLSAESAGLQIVLRATNQLENFPTAKAAFLNAAATWEALISTPITIIIDVDFGPTWFGEAYDKDVLGQTAAQELGDSSIYGEVRDSLVGLAANGEQAGLYSQLPQSAVPTDIGTTTYVLAPSPVWRALGFINPVADPGTEQSDLGDPPAVGFNSGFDYDFDPSNGVDSNKIDFDSVAVHELGHVLGFMSNTGYRELERTSPIAVSIWDIFRFRPGVTLDSFSTAQRILSSGGSQRFFNGGIDAAVSTGRPDGTGGDREQSSHWKDDRLTGQYVGIMDPTLADGQRDTITENDLAALRSFGYAVNGTPGDADAPTIKNVSFNGKKLKITGKKFKGALQVEINGLVLASTLELDVNGSEKKLQIKANASALNLLSGTNQVRVISDGVASNAFTFAF
jgi:hypothetical protein